MKINSIIDLVKDLDTSRQTKNLNKLLIRILLHLQVEFSSIYDDGKGKKTQGLAATLNIGAEYTMPFYDKFRVGFLYTSRIHGRYSYHQGMLSAAVRPVKWFEANLNTSGSSTGWQLGGMLSFYVNKFNFYLASDRMIWGKFGKPFIPLNRANTNISLGFNIPM